MKQYAVVMNAFGRPNWTARNLDTNYIEIINATKSNGWLTEESVWKDKNRAIRKMLHAGITKFWLLDDDVRFFEERTDNGWIETKFRGIHFNDDVALGSIGNFNRDEHNNRSHPTFYKRDYGCSSWLYLNLELIDRRPVFVEEGAIREEIRDIECWCHSKNLKVEVYGNWTPVMHNDTATTTINYDRMKLYSNTIQAWSHLIENEKINKVIEEIKTWRCEFYCPQVGVDIYQWRLK